MRLTFEMVKGLKAEYQPGEEVTGFVGFDSPHVEYATSINVIFVGELVVSIGKSVDLGVLNRAQDVFFCQRTSLWKGSMLPPKQHEWYFTFKVPPWAWLPLGGKYNASSTDTIVEVNYFLEIEIYPPRALYPPRPRKIVKIVPACPPGLLNQSLISTTTPDIQCTGLAKSELSPPQGFDLNRLSLRGRMRSPFSQKDEPKCLLSVTIDHPSEVAATEPLPFFIRTKFTHYSNDSVSPPVYLKRFDVEIQCQMYATTEGATQWALSVPSKREWTNQVFPVVEPSNWKTKKVPLSEESDTRKIWKSYAIPLSNSPTMARPHFQIRYSLRTKVEIECQGKTRKLGDDEWHPFRLLPGLLMSNESSDLTEAVPQSAGPEAEDFGWGTFSDEDTCPVCNKQLPRGSEETRAAHVDLCLQKATVAAQLAPRPGATTDQDPETISTKMHPILIVDDNDDCTARILTANLQHLRKSFPAFGQCLKKIVLAANSDTVEPLYQQQIQELGYLFRSKEVAWSERPIQNFVSKENLSNYSYIIYVGRDFHNFRNRIPTSASSDNPGPIAVNFANLILSSKWPHDRRFMETAWTATTSTAESRLLRQFDVIQDACLVFAWRYFRLERPGSDVSLRPEHSQELPAAVPIELENNRYRREMWSERDPAELEAHERTVAPSRLQYQKYAIEVNTPGVLVEMEASHPNETALRQQSTSFWSRTEG